MGLSTDNCQPNISLVGKSCFYLQDKLFFFKLLFGCSSANFGPFSRGQPYYPMLITVFVQVQPEGHQEPHNKVGSLSPAERLVGFELGTFQF